MNGLLFGAVRSYRLFQNCLLFAGAGRIGKCHTKNAVAGHNDFFCALQFEGMGVVRIGAIGVVSVYRRGPKHHRRHDEQFVRNHS